jgi:hypothetical protein
MMKETLSSLLSVKISFLDRKKWGNKGKPLPAPTVYQWRQGWRHVGLPHVHLRRGRKRENEEGYEEKQTYRPWIFSPHSFVFSVPLKP